MVNKSKKHVHQKTNTKSESNTNVETYSESNDETISRISMHSTDSVLESVQSEDKKTDEKNTDEKNTDEKNTDEKNTNGDSSENNDDNPVTVYVNKLNKYVETIAKMNSELKQLVTVGKTLEKDFNQIVKLLAKKNKNKSNENRALTGFAMPTYLTDEMYDFLNEHTEMKIEKGQKVHRIAVTRTLNKYIKDNGLRQEKDKRYFTPNSTLHRIFRSTENDEVSYFNLQKYIKHHFLKEYKKV